MKAPWKQLVAMLAVCLPMVTFAQTPAAEPAKPADAAAQPATPAPATTPAPAAMPAPTPAPAPAPAKEEGIKVTWYGFILANAFFDSSTFLTKDYPGQAQRVPGGAGGGTLLSARQTRFGLRLSTKDANWTGAELSANAEFDFKGGNIPGALTSTTTCTAPVPPATANTCTTTTTAAAPSTSWNGNVLRMRIATATATWKTGVGNVALMAGQAPGLVNTLFAESVGWIADPIFWQAGQIWRRVPQFRLSWSNTFDMVGVGLDLAALSPTDSPPSGSVPGASFDYGAGNRSRNPELEGRLSLNVKPMKDVSIAVGAAINKAKRTYDIDANKKTLSPSVFGIDADINVPYGQLKGEWYSGKGMDDAYNGMTATVTGAAGARKLVASKGYWAQAILKPVPEFWVTAGYGTAEGDKDDLVAVSAAARTSAAGTRAKNKQLAFGGIVNVGKPWRLGVEWVKVTTEYLGDAAADPNIERKANQLAISSQFRW